MQWGLWALVQLSEPLKSDDFSHKPSVWLADGMGVWVLVNVGRKDGMGGSVGTCTHIFAQAMTVQALKLPGGAPVVLGLNAALQRRVALGGALRTGSVNRALEARTPASNETDLFEFPPPPKDDTRTSRCTVSSGLGGRGRQGSGCVARSECARVGRGRGVATPGHVLRHRRGGGHPLREAAGAVAAFERHPGVGNALCFVQTRQTAVVVGVVMGTHRRRAGLRVTSRCGCGAASNDRPRLRILVGV